MSERTDAMESHESRQESGHPERTSGDHFDEMVQNDLGKEFSSTREFCQDLEQRGLLRLLSSGEPEQIGFTFEWYRHKSLRLCKTLEMIP